MKKRLDFFSFTFACHGPLELRLNVTNASDFYFFVHHSPCLIVAFRSETHILVKILPILGLWMLLAILCLRIYI